MTSIVHYFVQNKFPFFVHVCILLIVIQSAVAVTDQWTCYCILFSASLWILLGGGGTAFLKDGDFSLFIFVFCSWRSLCHEHHA